MTNQKNRAKDAADLRQKAEALARERVDRISQDSAALSPEEIRKTLHELRVHQIELEMQNEELRTAQDKIEAGRARYFDLYDLAPVGYLTLSEKGLILEANLTVSTLLGQARGALVKEPISRFILKEDQDIYYLHRKKLFETHSTGSGQACEPQECELRLFKPDGALIWAHLTGTVAQAVDGAPVCRVVISDISKRKRAEEKLRKSEERYRSYVDNAPDGVFITDENGSYVEVNQAACKITGYTETELLQMHISDILQKTEIEKGIQHFKEVQQNGSARGEIGFVTKSGENRFWHVAAVKLSDTRFLGFVKDITERNKAREEREKLQSQLLQAQKMESIGILTGGIAHDFNNLLHAMGGNLELLLKNKPDDHPDVKRLKTIEKSVIRSAQLIRQLLTFSRKAEPCKQSLDLDQEIVNAARVLERSIPKMVKIEFYPGEDIRLVNADPVQIEQVLLNLGVNAADAMPEGGKLIIETRNIDLDEKFFRTHPEMKFGPYVLLMVSDTGCGMDKDSLDKIFDPFFTTKEVGKGTGLGLSTVYGIVKVHEGYVTCYSEVGQGTTFKIYLPAAEPGMAAPDKKESMEEVSMGGPETILIVDDDDEIRELTHELLEDSGYQVLGAASGEQALEIFKEHTKEIDLVVMDLNMPGMGGRKCTTEMISIEPSVKVLVASGYSAVGHGREALGFGAKDFISKPYQMREILAKIREVLDGE